MNNSVNFSVLTLEEIDSTNTFASNYIKNNESEQLHGKVIRALNQTAGKGQMGNTWDSEKNRNLTFSIIFSCNFLRIDEQFYISKAVSLAIFDYLSTFIDDVKIKWPNDIYVKHNKIAGILIENIIMGNTLKYSIIGIGLNVNQTKFHKTISNPVSLKIISGKEEDLDSILLNLLNSIEKRFLSLKNTDFSTLTDCYLKALYRYGIYSEFRTDEKTVFKAKIIGISPLGELILETDKNEINSFWFKEVSFV